MSALTNDLFEAALEGKKRIDDLIPDSNITKTETRTINPASTYTGTSFTGEGVFGFSVPSNMCFIPSRSYFTIDTTITYGGAATQPSTAVDIAPAFNMGHNLFESMSLEIDQQSISKIAQNYPQVAAYNLRTRTEARLMDSMADTHFLESSFSVRRAKIASNGVKPNPYGTTETQLAGTVTIAGGALTTVTGAGTAFTSALIGKTIKVGATTGIVASVTSATEVKTDAAMVAAAALSPIYLVGDDATERSNINELCVVPALDVCQDASIVLPSGQYRLITNAVLSPTKAAVESKLADLVVGTATATFSVTAIKFNPFMAEYAGGSRPATYQYSVRSTEMKKVTHSTATAEYQVNVGANTDKIGITVAHISAGTNTLYSPSLFHKGAQITQLSCDYNSQLKPVGGSRVMSYGASTNKYLATYFDSMLENGLAAQSYESFSDFMARGPIHIFSFPKAKKESSTVCVVKVTTSAATDATLLVFAEGYRVFTIKPEKVGPAKVEIAKLE